MGDPKVCIGKYQDFFFKKEIWLKIEPACFNFDCFSFSPIVAFKSDKFNVYSLGDEMKKKGWLLSAMQYPTCIHLYITPMHTQKGIKEKFVKDLSNVVDDLMKDTNKPLDGRVSRGRIMY